MKTIKINLFDTEYKPEIVDNAILQITKFNKNILIPLVKISTISTDFVKNKGYTVWVHLVNSSLGLIISSYLIANSDFSNINAYLQICLVLLWIVQVWIIEVTLRSVGKTETVRMIIDTYDNNKYIITHYIDGHQRQYQYSPYEKHYDFYKIKQTLFNLHNQIIDAKAKIYKYEQK